MKGVYHLATILIQTLRLDKINFKMVLNCKAAMYVHTLHDCMHAFHQSSFPSKYAINHMQVGHLAYYLLTILHCLSIAIATEHIE